MYMYIYMYSRMMTCILLSILESITAEKDEDGKEGAEHPMIVTLTDTVQEIDSKDLVRDKNISQKRYSIIMCTSSHFNKLWSH